MSRNRLLFLAGTLAFVAAGCGESPMSPTAQSPAVRDASGDAGPFFPNQRKYRDNASHPAQGRSGSAVLEARALFGKDGMTTLEATTGTLDADGAPGTIAKMQTKVFTLGHEVASVDNTRPSTPTATQMLHGLVRDQVVQVQANVRGIDGNRNDVVTVETPVRIRPDLEVSNVQAPARVLTGGAPFSVTALVAERNGDVGARTTCALFVDGTQVDHTEGVWVDAGDAVTCSFAIRFANASDAGNHELKVQALDVTPGDWDNANNSASTTIAADRDVQLSRTGSASQQTEISYANYEQHYDHSYSCGLVCFVVHDFYTEVRENITWSYGASMTATSPEEITFPVAHLELGMTTGGATLDSQVLDDVAATSTFGDETNGGSCAWGINAGAEFHLCGAHSPSGGSTTLTYTRNGGAVTYLSYNYRNYQLCDVYFPPYDIYNRCTTYTNEYTYYSNQVLSNTGAPPVDYGGDFAFHALARTSDFRQFGGDLSFPVAESTTDYPSYRYCYQYPDVIYCYLGGTKVTTRSGSGSSNP